jgi:cytochrome P450
MVPCTIKGIHIPYNLVIAADVLTLHYDPDHWGPVDPHDFYRLRFSSEIKRHPCVYAPFGIGPRNCAGMKFALIEVKLSLVKLLSKFEIVKSEHTPTKLEFEEGPAIRRPKHGIPVIFKKRVF